MGWRAPTLNKGKLISHVDENGTAMTVERVDRRIDPYLAGVYSKGRIVYTGLHATLADARQTCHRKAKEAA